MVFSVGSQINVKAQVQYVHTDGTVTLKLETGQVFKCCQFDISDPRPLKRLRVEAFGRKNALQSATSSAPNAFEEENDAPVRVVTRQRSQPLTCSPLPTKTDLFFQNLPRICQFLSVQEVGQKLSLVCKRANEITKTKSFIRVLDIWIADDHAYVNYAYDYNFETRLTSGNIPGSSFCVMNDAKGTKTIVKFLQRFKWGNLQKLHLRVDNPQGSMTRDTIRALIEICQRANIMRGIRIEDASIDQGSCPFAIPSLCKLTEILVHKAKRMRDLSVHGIGLINRELIHMIQQGQTISDIQLNKKSLAIAPEQVFKDSKFINVHLDSFDLAGSPTLARHLLDCCEHLTLFNCRSLPKFNCHRLRSPRLHSITVNCRKGFTDTKLMAFLRSLPNSITVLKIRHADRNPPAADNDMWRQIQTSVRTNLTHCEWKFTGHSSQQRNLVTYPSRRDFPRLSSACIPERNNRSRRVQPPASELF